jgi:hypothetical protein
MMKHEPDPTDLFKTLGYIHEQASFGQFKGSPAGALQILTYLATYSWRREPNNEESPIGTVMWGKSGVKRIAAENSTTRRQVQRCLRWLATEGWIDCTLDCEMSGRSTHSYIKTMLNHDDHERRAKICAEGVTGRRPRGRL